jgi:hypothetical protein
MDTHSSSQRRTVYLQTTEPKKSKSLFLSSQRISVQAAKMSFQFRFMRSWCRIGSVSHVVSLVPLGRQNLRWVMWRAERYQKGTARVTCAYTPIPWTSNTLTGPVYTIKRFTASLCLCLSGGQIKLKSALFTERKETKWSESASDRRLSAKLVPTLAERGLSRSQRGASPTAIFSVF